MPTRARQVTQQVKWPQGTHERLQEAAVTHFQPVAARKVRKYGELSMISCFKMLAIDLHKTPAS